MDCSMPGFPVLHHLPELAQTHVHWAGDAIQPSHFLSSPSPPAFNLSQHQGVFKWVSSSHQVAKGLEFQLLHQFSSVQFSHSVVSNSLQPHELQHARPPRPSPTPGIHPNSCPSSQWCHPTISSSVILFSSCLQSFPASGSFSMSQLFASGGQRIGVSASASALPMNIQDWFPLGLTVSISLQSGGLSSIFSSTTVQMHQFFTSGAQSIGVSASVSVLPMNIHDWFLLGSTGWISLQSKGLWRVFSNTTVQKSINSSALSFLYGPALTTIHDYWKNHSFN